MQNNNPGQRRATPERAHIYEQWGDSPLFPGPCWHLSWELNKQHLRSLEESLINGRLWATSKACFANLESEACPWIGLKSNNSSGEAGIPIHLEAVRRLAEQLLSPARIDRCQPHQGTTSNRHSMALASIQHELAGQAITTASQLIWASHLQRIGSLPSQIQQSVQQALSILIQKAKTCCGDTLTMALLEEADRRKISIFLLDPSQRLYQLGSGAHSRWICGSGNDQDSCFGAALASDKARCNEILKQLGLPVPKEVRLPHNATSELVVAAAQKIGFPCVIKPQDGERGRGVTANIKNISELRIALEKAKQTTKRNILLQEHVAGSDHRLNVTNGHLAFAVRRSAPRITGNGRDSVEQLIIKENLIRKQLRKEDGTSAAIDPYDREVTSRLTEAQASLSTIIKEGTSIQLRSNANLSTGGLREELDASRVHPEIRSQCEAIAKTFRLNACGIDYITRDIEADPRICGGAFIEINSMPQNSPKRAQLILSELFPDQCESDIPATAYIANWHSEDRAFQINRLKEELKKHEHTTTGYNRAAEEIIKSPGEDPSRDLIHMHSYRHPREALLNHAIDRIIYLATPKEVLQQGLPFLREWKILTWNRGEKRFLETSLPEIANE